MNNELETYLHNQKTIIDALTREPEPAIPQPRAGQDPDDDEETFGHDFSPMFPDREERPQSESEAYTLAHD